MILVLLYFIVLGTLLAIIYYDSKRWIAGNHNQDVYLPTRGPYTFDDWNKEVGMLGTSELVGLKGSPELRCPWCKVYGSYGPRYDHGRRYRACKNCKTFQNIEENTKTARVLWCEHCKIGKHTLSSVRQRCSQCRGFMKFTE